MNQQAELVSIHSPVEQAHISLETGPHGLDSPAWIGKRKISFLQIKSNLVILTIEFEQIVCYSAPFLSYYLISAVLNTGKEYLCQFLRLNYHLRRKNFNFVNLYSLLLVALILLRLILTGMHDQGVESEFQWSDGSAVQFTYWDGWQPDNWRDSEDCANVRNVNDGRWNDQSCYNSLPYICKKPKGVFQNRRGF